MVVVGTWLGVRANRRLPRRWFEMALLAIAVAGALRLLAAPWGAPARTAPLSAYGIHGTIATLPRGANGVTTRSRFSALAGDTASSPEDVFVAAMDAPRPA